MEKLLSKVRKFWMGIRFCRDQNEKLETWKTLRERLANVDNPYFVFEE